MIPVVKNFNMVKNKKETLEDRILRLEAEYSKVNKDDKNDEVKKENSKEPWHTTIYDIEYCPKFVKKERGFKPLEEKEHDGDPIAYAYKNDLKSDYELEKIEDKCTYENGDCYFYKKKPSITKVVESAVNQNAVKEVHLDEGRTLYQIDYCKRHERAGIGLAPIVANALEFQDIEIPEKWQPLPLTEYRSSYKDHRGIAPWNISPDPPVRPIGEFTSSVEREKQFIDPSLGETEYQDVIGGLGKKIITDEYHGQIQPLPYELIIDKEEEVSKTFSSV